MRVLREGKRKGARAIIMGTNNYYGHGTNENRLTPTTIVTSSTNSSIYSVKFRQKSFNFAPYLRSAVTARTTTRDYTKFIYKTKKHNSRCRRHYSDGQGRPAWRASATTQIVDNVYRKTSIKRLVSIKRRSQIAAGGFRGRVPINAGSQINAGLK